MSPLKVTLIQTALHWENKEANLSMLEGKINGIVDTTHIIVLPEMFSTGFSMKPEVLAEGMDGPTLQWMKNMAIEKKVIITGSVIIKENNAYYNRLIWMLPNGQCGYYDKRHLFGYAGEDQHYQGGNKRFIASVNGWRINLIVCYDLRFPVWIRQQPTEGEDFEYDLLICIANWPERRALAWKTLLQARAIENQCYVVGVNRVGEDGNNIYHSGDSSVIDALGEVLYQKQDEEDIFTITLDKKALEAVRTKLPFSRDSDAFQILV
jgi:predicted amidohydrolase